MNTYRLPRPTMGPRERELLAGLHRDPAAVLERPVDMMVEGVAAQIGPAPSNAWGRGPSRPPLSWTYGSVSGTAPRLDIALQDILVQAIRSRMPAPLELTEFETRRVFELVADVDSAVAVYRDRLLRRTGIAWSCRVGSRKHRSTITISSMPSKRVEQGRMPAGHCALLAALAGRDFVNPVSGLSVGNSARERAKLAVDFAGASSDSSTILECRSGELNNVL